CESHVFGLSDFGIDIETQVIMVRITGSSLKWPGLDSQLKLYYLPARFLPGVDNASPITVLLLPYPHKKGDSPVPKSQGFRSHPLIAHMDTMFPQCRW